MCGKPTLSSVLDPETPVATGGIEDMDLGAGEEFVPFPDRGILSLECDLAHLQEIVHR